MQDISNAKLMEFKKLIDRGAELERMNEALHRSIIHPVRRPHCFVFDNLFEVAKF